MKLDKFVMKGWVQMAGQAICPGCHADSIRGREFVSLLPFFMLVKGFKIEHNFMIWQNFSLDKDEFKRQWWARVVAQW